MSVGVAVGVVVVVGVVIGAAELDVVEPASAD